MAELKFRPLTAEEIDVRVAQARRTGVALLLYKNSRCDQNILDETVTPLNWQRHHTRDNANCIVSIWDEDKKQWIEKEDTGVESNTEKEKGLASDSFKRACFNWGIGRELYTAPFIWVPASECLNLSQNGQKWQCQDSFEVVGIQVENKRISRLEIRNAKTKRTCFSWVAGGEKGPTGQKPAAMTPTEAADTVVPFGPYTGRTLREVFNTDKGYLTGLDLNACPPDLAKAINIMMDAYFKTKGGKTKC